MPKLSNANKRPKVIRALRRAGFQTHPGGKHLILTDSDGNFVCTIPNHAEVYVETLRLILKQCGLSAKKYLELY